MKRPTVASLKKVSAENLEALGSARLARSDEAVLPPELAEVWAGRLRVRQPAAAAILLSKAAAAAFRCREFAVSTRLSEEADALDAASGAQPAEG